MVIQCEQCSTKFRLDDSRVTEKGVKVRCAKCRHVFSVKKTPLETETQTDLDAMINEPNPDFGAMFDEKISQSADQEPSAQTDSQHEDSSVPASTDLAEMLTEPDPDFGAMFDERGAAPTEQEPLAEVDFQQQGTPLPDSSLPGFDYSDFDFAGKENLPDAILSAPVQEEPPPGSAPGSVDFPFSTDEEQGLALKHKETQDESATAPPYNLGDVDMDRPVIGVPDDGMEFNATFEFGDVPTSATPGDSPAPLADIADIPDFGFDENFTGKEAAAFTDEETRAIAIEPAKTGIAEAVEPSPSPAPAADTPVELVADSVVAAGEKKRSEEPPQAPEEAAPQTAEDDLPPLSIASRRKQNKLLGILIAVATIIIVALLGFFGYTLFMEDKVKSTTETDKIRISAVNASFIKNPTIGELLVITGEAVNGFTKARAAIQVKGIVFGAKGEVLVSKNAYCGNPFTKEQLATLPLDKIEAAMANQFGDSLANMEVPPGKAIPFVIVIATPPATAKDYGVESVGSTVAAGKQ